MRVIPPEWVGSRCLLRTHRPEGSVTKSGREIMEILEAYDLTGCAHSAAQLAGFMTSRFLRTVLASTSLFSRLASQSFAALSSV